jgi:hypothetical protein
MGTRKWGTYYHGVNQLWEHYKNVNQFWFRVYPMYIQWIVGSHDIKKKLAKFSTQKKKKNIELYTSKIIRKNYPTFVSETQQNTGHQYLFVGGRGGGVCAGRNILLSIQRPGCSLHDRGGQN